MTTKMISEIEKTLAASLNHSAHKSPITVRRALNIDAPAHRDITVERAGGNFWAGCSSLNQGFCFNLGPTPDQAQKAIESLNLP